ncbi:hypothetical protein L1987_87189 [Smallanthus sonchifolius]|nr:hypothetical protein L1987_87189 [Smallanthus sonchifolius]
MRGGSIRRRRRVAVVCGLTSGFNLSERWRAFLQLSMLHFVGFGVFVVKVTFGVVVEVVAEVAGEGGVVGPAYQALNFLARPDVD